MSDERFPIINFKQRQQDNLRVEGNGGDKKYSWYLEGEDLQNKSISLIEMLNHVKDDLPNYVNTETGIPITLEVSFIDDAKAKTHQSKIIEMFVVADNNGQIGMENDNSILIMIEDSNSIDHVLNNVIDTVKNQGPVSSIETIELYRPEINAIEENDVYMLDFLNFQNKETNEKVVTYVKEQLVSQNISYEEILYNEKEEILRLDRSVYDKLEFIRNLPIKSINPVVTSESPFPIETDVEVPEFNFVEFDEQKTYPIVGLLDSGVEINEQTKNWVVRGNGCFYEDGELNKSHGTFIATLLIHGDKINQNSDCSISGCRIVDVPIVPFDEVEEWVLIRNIRRAIMENLEVKIWNLSISIRTTISSNQFSKFAISLDEIQDEFNVIICKSAGNDPSFFEGSYAGLLSSGAESVRSITVGSICRNSDDFSSSKENHPSQYSRHGRGPAHIIKPEVVHYGGDVFSLIDSPQYRNHYEVKGEISFGLGQKKLIEPGTSFSTPKIAKNLAELDLLINRETDPLLLKSLLIHSTSYVGNPSMTDDEKLNYLGYGKPLNSNEILVSDSPHSATLILNGRLEKGQKIDVMDFPYPDNLIKDGKFTGLIKITLVYNTYLEKDLGPEYCQSNLDLKFGTYEEKMDRDTTRRNIINPIGRKDSKNFLLRSNYSKKYMRSNQHYATERTLIEYGDKYYPVKKFAADLGELKNSLQISSISGQRKWFLYICGQYRDFVKNNRSSDILSMDYCLVVTISDPDNEVNVHNGVMRALELNNFEHNDINVNVDIAEQIGIHL